MRSGALGRLGSAKWKYEEMNVLGLRDSDGDDANGALQGNQNTPYPPATIKYKITSDLDNPTGSSDQGSSVQYTK